MRFGPGIAVGNAKLDLEFQGERVSSCWGLGVWGFRLLRFGLRLQIIAFPGLRGLFYVAQQQAQSCIAKQLD